MPLLGQQCKLQMAPVFSPLHVLPLVSGFLVHALMFTLLLSFVISMQPRQVADFLSSMKLTSGLYRRGYVIRHVLQMQSYCMGTAQHTAHATAVTPCMTWRDLRILPTHMYPTYTTAREDRLKSNRRQEVVQANATTITHFL